MSFKSRIEQMKKNQRKGISPVIATIILIAVALVLALVVGVFAFGLFTSQTKNVSMTSGNLYAATPSFDFSLKNPGSADTGVSTVTVGGLACTPAAAWTATGVAANAVSPLSCTPSATLNVGDVYDYVINLNSGQSISGSLVAQ